jgi:TetR/AcrR family transcriptional regulator, mexJK operon transcriptional repressor
MPTTPITGRSALKRQSILAAGQRLFLEHGYQGTSMDQVAASASVSKQTVYKHFREKRELLFAIVTDALDGTAAAIGHRITAVGETTDLEADLTDLAGAYLRAVLQEPVVQLRRLVVGEANRLPELARLYYEHAPLRTLSSLADAFARLHDRGLLTAPEPGLAAEHFAFLIVGKPIDQALFDGAAAALDAVDVDTYVRAGVRVFLAGYRSR